MQLNSYFMSVLFIASFSLVSLNANANMVTAVNLTNSSIDFTVEGGGGPLMGPNEDGSASGGTCCAYIGSWHPGKTVTVKWKADKAPFNYSKNPYKRYSDKWYEWSEEDRKKNVTHHKAEVSIPQYHERGTNIVAIFLPCHQVMVVNTGQGYKSDKFPEKATIQQRYKELTALEKANKCPSLQYPAKQTSY